MAAAKKRLGRGLDALIREEPAGESSRSPEAPPSTDPQTVPITSVRPNPGQPRKEFAPEALQELVTSIREHGVLQPLLVRTADSGYELIAGERRYRAAGEAGLTEVPIVLREVTDREALELALIENLQREDLNMIEEARGYRQLAEKFDLTQEAIADRVGKGRTTIANALRLLDLAEPVQRMLADNKLSPGHAKVLLGVEIEQEQVLLAERVVHEQLSVRKLEGELKKLRDPGPSRSAGNGEADIPGDHLRHLHDELHHLLGTSVRITSSRTFNNGKKGRGAIEIDYYSPEDLNRILGLLGYEEEAL